MDKHAYLIMAHNNWDTLEKLIQLIDDARNEIFIHIDKKAIGFDINRFLYLPKNSNINIYQELKIYWGGYSQIECELLLLKKAIEYNCTYYHILSGSDLPIKTQDYIHEFFQRNTGYEFVHYQTDEYIKNDAEISRRVTISHYLQNYRKRFRFAFLNYCFTYFDKGLIALQMVLKVNKGANKLQIKYGSNWASITNNLAKYIIENEAIIEDMFRKSNCADELFIQTLVFNSEFKEKLYNQKFDNKVTGNMRLIDWNRGNGKGNPYVWHKKDFKQIMESECLFARKFDYTLDGVIIEKIYNKVKARSNLDSPKKLKKIQNTLEGSEIKCIVE